MSPKPYLKRGIDLVNIARTLFGFDKKPEPVEEPEEKPKSDPRLEKKSKFVRPKKKNQKKSKSFDPVKKVENDDEN